MDSKGTQPSMYTYPFSPKLPSHPGCHTILSRVPCAVQQVLAGSPCYPIRIIHGFPMLPAGNRRKTQPSENQIPLCRCFTGHLSPTGRFLPAHSFQCCKPPSNRGLPPPRLANCPQNCVDGNFGQRHSMVLSHELWLSGKDSFCQCRRWGFDPWVGKIPWRRTCQPTPVFLPGESHGQRNLEGYSPWGCRQSETTHRLREEVRLASKFRVGRLCKQSVGAERALLRDVYSVEPPVPEDGQATGLRPWLCALLSTCPQRHR